MTQAPKPLDLPTDDDNDDQTGDAVGLSRQFLVSGALAFIAVVAILAVVFGGDDDNVTASAAGLDGFEFITEDGEIATLADFRGSPMVVNFYASWCAPCRAELPHFVDVAGEAGDRVQFLGVSHDIDQSSWMALNDEFELNYPTVYQREQEIFEELDLLGMPATAFISADGEVLYTFTGVLNQETLKDLIAEHLGVEV
ncbi:MAG: TlpA disulfide reductase family protein [Actinomycetota bacterium]